MSWIRNIYEGRINRVTYLVGILLFTALGIPSFFLKVPMDLVIIYALYVILDWIIISSFWIRRFHDIGRSGWWFLLVFITPLILILTIILFCVPGNSKANKYGIPPIPGLDVKSFLRIFNLSTPYKLENKSITKTSLTDLRKKEGRGKLLILIIILNLLVELWSLQTSFNNFHLTTTPFFCSFLYNTVDLIVVGIILFGIWNWKKIFVYILFVYYICLILITFIVTHGLSEGFWYSFEGILIIFIVWYIVLKPKWHLFN